MELSATGGNDSGAKIVVRKQHKAYATYQKVLDGRKQPIRGLWQRNGRFYARLKVDDPNGGDRTVRRVPLEANTVAEAQSALRHLMVDRSRNTLPVLKRTPKFA